MKPKADGQRPLRVGGLIQCTSSDLYASTDPEDYCIGVVQRSGLFDAVLLVVPDDEESSVFDSLASVWGVGLVKGSVFNVGERLLKAAEQHHIDVIARLLLRRFYLDVSLVGEMIHLLISEEADYICLPHDFNYELGADVFTREALARVVASLKGQEQGVASRRFAPWRVMDEDRKNFKTLEHPGTPNYPPQKVASIKKKLGALLEENQVHYGWQFPASAYAFVGRFFEPGGVVLDIACGQGSGTRQLIEFEQQVVGVDLDAEYVHKAAQRFSAVEGLSYICADAMSYSQPTTYDDIVSMHTLEHLPRAKDFLQLCHGNLKPQGKLFLEVPLLLPRPLGEPLYPFHSMEYTIQELDTLCLEAGFRIDKKIGRDRGVYTNFESTREAVQYHCSKA